MHPNDGRVVSNFIIQALRNEDITVYGEGNQTRSFCYVDDLVDGLIRLMGTPDDVTGPVNLGNPNEFTIRQLAESVIALTGSSSKIVYRPLPEDDPKQRCPDINLAKKLLAWEPRVQLQDGLDENDRVFRPAAAVGSKRRAPADPLGQSRGLSPKHRSGPCPARFGFVLPKIEIWLYFILYQFQVLQRHWATREV
jgi:hypothetical protein